MGATLQRQVIGSGQGLLVAAAMAPYYQPPDENRCSTKVIFKNDSTKKLKIKIDADRQIDSFVSHGWKVNADMKVFGIGGGFDAKSNHHNEYEAYHIVDTNESFSIVNCWERKSFYPTDDENLHAFLTIQSQNPDGSWLMIAENHSILKRCNVTYSNTPRCQSGIYVNHKGIDQIIPHFSGKYARLEEQYKLGFVEVINKSKYDVLVRVDSDGINPKKIKSEAGGSLQAEAKQVKLKLGGEKVNEVTKNVYYRANQKNGYTFLEDSQIAQYFIKITNDTYYVSVDYIKDGELIEHQKIVPYHYYSVDGIPQIIIYRNHKTDDILVVSGDPKEDKDENMGSCPDPIRKDQKKSKKPISQNANEVEIDEELARKYYFLDDPREKKR